MFCNFSTKYVMNLRQYCSKLIVVAFMEVIIAVINNKLVQRSIFLACSFFILSGCASLNGKPLPVQITSAPDPDLQYSEVIADVAAYRGVRVRWGGEIVTVNKGETQTEIEVLEHPITEKGRPDYEHNDSKRHRARFSVLMNNDFVHRRLKRNNFITVYGLVTNSKDMVVNDNVEYVVPVIQAEETMTWPSARQYDFMRSRWHWHSDFHFYHNFYHPRRYYYGHPRHYFYYRKGT